MLIRFLFSFGRILPHGMNNSCSIRFLAHTIVIVCCHSIKATFPRSWMRILEFWILRNYERNCPKRSFVGDELSTFENQIQKKILIRFLFSIFPNIVYERYVCLVGCRFPFSRSTGRETRCWCCVPFLFVGRLVVFIFIFPYLRFPSFAMATFL